MLDAPTTAKEEVALEVEGGDRGDINIALTDGRPKQGTPLVMMTNILPIVGGYS